jgi:hypothetical protein
MDLSFTMEYEAYKKSIEKYNHHHIKKGNTSSKNQKIIHDGHMKNHKKEHDISLKELKKMLKKADKDKLQKYANIVRGDNNPFAGLVRKSYKKHHGGNHIYHLVR